MTDEKLAPEGHNLGSVPTPEIIREVLAEENTDLTARRDELLESCDRMPEKVEDEDTSKRFAEQKRLLRAVSTNADERRKATKEPYLEGGRAVDAFFGSIKDPMAGAIQKIDAAQTAYMRRKEQAERKRRAEEAERAREAARKAEEEAASALKSDDETAAAQAQEKAMAAAEEAEKSAQAAGANPAELSRVRGDYGATSSLRTRWIFEDLDRAQLDLEALRPYLPQDALEKALRAYIKAGFREIRGATIKQDYKAV